MKTHSFLLRTIAYAIMLCASYSSAALAQAAQDTTYYYQYDAVGNLTQITDPLGRVTNQTYDALNRLRQQLQPAPVAGASRPVIGYSYDGLDQLVSVTDPRNLVTSYGIDGLGNQTTLVSPDTGAAAKTYDAAGNVVTSTDAKGQTTRYQYDALNRITRIEYHDGQIVSYGYDQGTYGLGRLTQITDASGTIAYTYTLNGKLASETRTINGVAYVTRYAYDASFRLQTLTYPSGRTLSYQYDPMGRIAHLSSTSNGGATQVIASNISYQPFGGIRSYVNGANRPITRSFDLDGRMTNYTLGGRAHSLSYDAASRITLLWDTANVATVHNYGYDGLDRLTSYSGPINHQSLHYDAVGNRIQSMVGTSNTNYVYGATSNRLTQVSNSQTRAYQTDPNGSIVHNGLNQFTFDARGRMISATTAIGNVGYTINALGQRIVKTTPTGTTLFHYDHRGQLIGESNSQGVFNKEYVYLHDMPVALFAAAAGPMYVIETDHLNTPRLVTDQSGNVVWQWNNDDPFGNNLPSSSVGFEFNLRFPGQYFDRETNLHYNYFRDYDPSTGRYVQSDPIGLEGGLNTYSYVGGNPLSYVDPLGLLIGTTLGGAKRNTTLEQATQQGAPARAAMAAGGATAAVGAALTPVAPAAARGAYACYKAVEEVKDPCRNAFLAAILGAGICGQATGTVKGSARSYARDRERIEDVGNAAARTPRRNTGTVPD